MQVRRGFAFKADVLCKTVGSAYASSNLAPATTSENGPWPAVTAVGGSGTPYDTMAVKQVDANTFTYEAKKTGGKYQATGRLEVSKDRKTLTLTSKGTDADGKAMSLTLVTEKQ